MTKLEETISIMCDGVAIAPNAPDAFASFGRRVFKGYCFNDARSRGLTDDSAPLAVAEVVATQAKKLFSGESF